MCSIFVQFWFCFGMRPCLCHFFFLRKKNAKTAINVIHKILFCTFGKTSLPFLCFKTVKWFVLLWARFSLTHSWSLRSCVLPFCKMLRAGRKTPSPSFSLCVWGALGYIEIWNGLCQFLYTRTCMQAHMTTLTNTQLLNRRHVDPVSQAENKLIRNVGVLEGRSSSLCAWKLLL